MSKVLIFGATGNLGGLTTTVLDQNHPEVSLRLVSSRPEALATLAGRFPRAEVVYADWLKTETLIPALAGVEKVFVVVPDFVTDEPRVTENIVHAVKAVGTRPLIVRLIAIPPGLSAADLSPAVLATRCGAAIHALARPVLEASGLPVTFVNVPCWIMFNLPWFLAGEIRAHRQLAMPAASDAPRQWISEADVAAVAAKILTDESKVHVGREYLINGVERYDYRQQAELLSEVLGYEITFRDDPTALHAIMGPNFDAVMTYFADHETRDYRNVQATDTVESLLGRPPVTLREYLVANKGLFV